MPLYTWLAAGGGLLIAGLAALCVRRVPPGVALGFFADSGKTHLTKWQQSGMAIVLPWHTTGTLQLAIQRIEVTLPITAQANSPLRFFVGISTDNSRLVQAFKNFTNAPSSLITHKATSTITEALQYMTLQPLQNNRKDTEPMLFTTVDSALAALGLTLFSANFDAFFGDAPEVTILPPEIA